jgi:iron complex outermembrane receptor protein
LRRTLKFRKKSAFKGYQLNVNSPVFKLPAGTEKIAAGYESQRYSMIYGVGTGNEPGDPRKPDDYWREETTRDVNSGCLELYVPVFGAQNTLTGVHRLDMTAAVRFDDDIDLSN